MPVYTWKCKNCGERVEVVRSVEDYKVPPPPSKHEWERIITVTPVMWEDARDKGVFEQNYKWPSRGFGR